MSALLWGVAAIVAGVAAIWIGMKVVVGRRAPPLEGPLPATPLQRLARRGLLLGLALTAGLVGVVMYYGPERTFEDDGVRRGFTMLLLAILAVFGVLAVRLMSWLRREDGTLDERDRVILAGSHSLRSVSILLTLVVWVIGLQETFWSAGAVPVFYLTLVFWSCLVVSLLALPLGILFGYRRS